MRRDGSGENGEDGVRIVEGRITSEILRIQQGTTGGDGLRWWPSPAAAAGTLERKDSLR